MGTGEKKKTTASSEENNMEGLLKFVEVLNRMKRFKVQKVPQTPKVGALKAISSIIYQSGFQLSAVKPKPK